MGTTVHKNKDGSETCIFLLSPDNVIHHYVLGTPWFNKFYTVFDMRKKKIKVGFAPINRMLQDHHTGHLDICESDIELDLFVKGTGELTKEGEMSLDIDTEFTT